MSFEIDGWAELPEVVLEDVYSLLRVPQRYSCSMVCDQWHRAFYSPRIWQKLVIWDKSFTARRFKYMRRDAPRTYQYELSHFRVQACFGSIGQFVRQLIVQPMTNYHNLYQFLNALSAFLEYYEEYPLPRLQTFEFTFSCETYSVNGRSVLGTGGQLLQELKRLLGDLQGLSELKLNHLLLNSQEAIGLLECIMDGCKNTLKKLEILNSTKTRYPLYYAGMFPNLQKLIISPPQLTDDVAMMVARNTKVCELVIVQDAYTPPAEPVSPRAWWQVRENSPKLEVQLEVRGVTNTEVMIQEHAPVRGILYRSPHSQVSVHSILQISDQFGSLIRTYGHTGLPRKQGEGRSFHDRIDSHLVLLIRECPNIETLIIRDRISTMTVLILASEAKHLQKFYVRRNAVIKKTDWMKAAHWSDDFYQWLKTTSRCYDMVDAEVSKLFDRPWQMLSDRDFKDINI